MQERIPKQFEPFSDRLLEQFLCDELDAQQASTIEAAMAQRPELAEYIRSRRAERAAFVLQHRPPLLETNESRPPSLPTAAAHWRRWLLGTLGATGLACALVLLALPSPPQESPQDPTATDQLVRAKGALPISLVVRRQGRLFGYDNGVLLRGGDELRMSLHAPHAGYLTVIGRARDGYSTLYDNIEVRAGDNTAPGSLILDDEPVDEQWIALLTPTMVDSATQIAALRAGKPPDAVMATVTIRREPNP